MSAPLSQWELEVPGGRATRDQRRRFFDDVFFVAAFFLAVAPTTLFFEALFWSAGFFFAAPFFLVDTDVFFFPRPPSAFEAPPLANSPGMLSEG